MLELLLAALVMFLRLVAQTLVIESVLQRMQMFSILFGLLEPPAIASTVERPNAVLELQRLVAPIVLAMNLMQIELIMIDCASQALEHGLWLDLPYAAKYWYVWLAYLSMGAWVVAELTLCCEVFVCLADISIYETH